MTVKNTQATGRRVDPFQDEAINCRELGIRIVAPAGSGKTETLVRRAIKRITTDEVQPSRMLILSYDNSAKRSFEQKYGRLASRTTKPQITTLNSFGNQLLQRHFSEHFGQLMTSGPREEQEFRRWVRREFDHPNVLTWDGRHQSMTDAFTRLKQQGFFPLESESERAHQWLRRHFLDLPEPGESSSVEKLWSLDQTVTSTEEHSVQIAGIFQAYIAADHYLRERGWMDYDDQKLRPVQVLWKQPDARNNLRSRYDEIVVDECQDVNRLEALLIYYATGPATTLVLAGDDDQSLYEFKEANSLYLREPERFFRDREFTTCHLNINYRSPEEILTPAQNLIECNSARLPKEPASGVSYRGYLETHVAAASREHDNLLAERVRALIGSRGATTARIEPHDIAILCPNEDVKRRMRQALERLKVSTAKIPVAYGQRQEEGVIVDTMRKAKGRQWPVVVLPASEDALMPGDRSVRVGDLESQRRQFYVAMTRPTERLIVGYVRDGDVDEIYTTPKGEVLKTNGASRFLFEVGVVRLAAPAPSTISSTSDQRTDPPRPVSITAEVQMPTSDKPVAPLPAATSSVPTTPLAIEKPASTVSSTADAFVPAPATRMSASALSRESVAKEESLTSRTRASKPCDLRVKELANLEKAAKLLGNDPPDTKYALVEAWTVIQNVLARADNPKNPRPDPFNNIKSLSSRALLDLTWTDTLHTWRKVRNDVIKEDKDIGPWERANIEQMVHQTSAAVAHIRERMEPKQPSLFVNDQKMLGIDRLVTCIQTGSPHPSTKRPVRALRYRLTEDGKDMLILQLLMILRDVRYYTPEDVRWTSSPEFARLSNHILGFSHGSIRGRANNLLVQSGRDALDIDNVLYMVAREELGEMNLKQAFREVFDIAASAANGDFPGGLKLTPQRH